MYYSSIVTLKNTPKPSVPSIKTKTLFFCSQLWWICNFVWAHIGGSSGLT